MTEAPSKSDFIAWVQDATTKWFLTQLHELRHEYVETLASGGTLTHIGREGIATAELVGFIKGLDGIVDIVDKNLRGDGDVK